MQNRENTSSVRNVSQLSKEIGMYHFMHHLMKTKMNNPKIDIMDYNAAKDIIPGFIPQLYCMEMLFPPGISFMDGLIQENGADSTPELIADLEGDNSIATLAVARYPRTSETEKIAGTILGYVPENMLFLAGYALVCLENEQCLNDLGILSYTSSVITHPDYRNFCGIGSRMMRPIYGVIDPLGKSYLTTWVDTGNGSINLSHHPGVGFWYKQYYDPIGRDLAEIIIPLVERKHRKHGITGRKYGLEEVTAKEIQNKLYGTCFERQMGPPGTKGYGFKDTLQSSIVIMPEHYEIGWSGIVMVRDPEKVKARLS